MSAPAIKLRPAPINTIARIAGSALPRSTFSMMPSGTPGESALTGGLSTVMTPIPSTFSKRTSAPSAIAVCDGGLAIGDLARAAFMAQLARRLDQQEQPVHARMAIREAAAIGVDRQAAIRRDAA